jgi:COMPASS component SWD3
MLWSPLSSDAPISPSPLTAHSNYASTLAFSPKGNMLVSGSYDEAVMLWDVRSGRCMRTLPAHSDPVRGVDFVADGTMVVSCSTDGLIRIWDAFTGQCLRTLVDEDRKGVTSVMFTPNGKFILAWTLDNCMRLWNYADGRCVKTYQGHVNKDFSLAGTVGSYFWSNNAASVGDQQEDEEEAAFVASGSEDGDVVLWDVTTKEILWRASSSSSFPSPRHQSHRDVVLSVHASRPTPEAPALLVSVGKDRDLRLWIEDIDPATLAARVARKENGQDPVARVAAGYAVDDDDDDVDARIRQMQMHEADGAMDVDAAENGHAHAAALLNGTTTTNGHAMDVDS